MRRRLTAELDGIAPELVTTLDAHRFDRSWFVETAERLIPQTVEANRATGVIGPPRPGDIIDAPEPGSERAVRLEKRGLEIIAEGQAALVVLAGGMATRMGGVVKALVEALPGRTFLDLRLAEVAAHEKRTGRAPPFWLMTSHATHDAIVRALGNRADGYAVAAFPQRLALRLDPDGKLFRRTDGQPSEHAPGHGDLVDALRDSGLLQRFVDRGGRYLTVANLDNLGAALEPTLLGLHEEHGKPATCEVVDKVGSDMGGIPARLDGRAVILEDFRVPRSFDAASVRVFNTNTFTFDARALNDLDVAWTYFRVEKTVEDRPAVQFERLIGEVTSHLDTQYVRVPREGAGSRFLPVKDHDELARRRPELEAVLRVRGIVG